MGRLALRTALNNMLRVPLGEPPGLIVSLAVIVMTLPLFNRITLPDNARFE